MLPTITSHADVWTRRLCILPTIKQCLLLLLGITCPLTAVAADSSQFMDFTRHWAGFAALAVFFLAYSLVIAEEALHLRKSKPVMVAAGIIWTLVAVVYAQHGDTHTAESAVRHNLLEFAELFLFLLAAMTYINAMDERGVFDVLRVKLVTSGFSLRAIFWITGGLAFVMSPIADNLTTALLLATVAIAVGGDNTKFIAVACINIVVAANAGGAFSPFGDITTPDGLAERPCRVPGILRPVYTLGGQLAGTGGHHEPGRWQGVPRCRQ